MKELSLREVQLMQLELIKEVDKVCLENNITYYLIAGSCLGAVRHTGFIPWDDDIDIAMMRSEYERFLKLFDDKFNTEKYFLQNYNTDAEFTPALSRICIKGTLLDVKPERHYKTCKNTYIDIFPLDNVPDDPELRELQKKNIRIIRRLIAVKQYRLYRDSRLEYIIKRTVSLVLRVIPLGYLQRRLVEEMTRCSSYATSKVCSMASGYSYDRQSMNRDVYGTPIRVLFEGVELNAPEHTDEYLRSLYGENYMTPPTKDKIVHPHPVYLLK